jgi:hypothetical protein
MSNGVEKFDRFRQEQARLNDPEVARGAVEFVPISLSEVVSVEGKKKKKKQQAARSAGRTPSATLSASAADSEALLPTGFIERLRAPGGSAHERERREIKTPPLQGAPQIEVEPQSVACRLNMFLEEAFAVSAPAARQVEFVWHEAGGSAVQRVVMDHSQADQFEASIGIADGAYLCAFALDSHMRPDARLARRIVLRPDGLFAPLTLARTRQTLTLRNMGTADESVLLAATAPWLVLERDTVELPASQRGTTSVRFDLSVMTPGLNEGLIYLSVRREGKTAVAGVVHIAAQVEVGGAVPEFSFTPRAFGEVRQGIDQVQLRIEVKAHGRGSLAGMISLPHSNELADFHLNADDEAASRFVHTFQVESAHLSQPQPHRTEAALKVMILTDSFLANYRLYRLEIPYRLIHLKKSLYALDFGTVRTGGTKTMRLDVTCSNGREIDLSVVLPPAASTYLEAYAARATAYVFRFDAGTLAPGTSVSEIVELFDRKSGLRDRIKILATVGARADESERAAANSRTS